MLTLNPRYIARVLKEDDMKTVGFATLVLVLLMSGYAYAEGDNLRFDFQQATGEGQYELFRVDADLAGRKGELCFFSSIGLELSNEAIYDLTGNTIWSRIPDMMKFERKCSKFDLYGSANWFFTQPINYTGAEYRFFFVGSLNAKAMKGTLHQFRSYTAAAEKRTYRTTEEIKLSVPAVVLP